MRQDDDTATSGVTAGADDPTASTSQLPGDLDESEVRSLPERFSARRILGRGGMGLVLEAHDRTLQRDVAVKVLPLALRSEGAMRTRFLREARAAAVLRHAGIVTIYDVDPKAGFIVMELVRGESL